MPEGRDSAMARVRGLTDRVRPLMRRLVDRVGDRRVTTAGVVTSEELGDTDPEHLFYLASSWLSLRRGLKGYRVRTDDVFVDFGSGKGRVVYQAACMPFRRVIGIELHPELTAVAQANIDRNRDRLTCPDVEFLSGDMTAVSIPEDMTVAYLFNSITGQALRRLVDNIVASLDRHPRRLRLIYAWPAEPEAITDTGRFRLVSEARRPWDHQPTVQVFQAI